MIDACRVGIEKLKPYNDTINDTCVIDGRSDSNNPHPRCSDVRSGGTEDKLNGFEKVSDMRL